MNIHKEQTRYWIENEEKKTLGELEFSQEENSVVITHTFVDPTVRGEGLGSKLIAVFVEDMRNKGRKVNPVCPFAKAEFDKHPEYHDIAL